MVPSTAGTENRPYIRVNVHNIGVPPAARALTTLPHVDYEDGFLLETDLAETRTAEQWARAIIEETPTATRKALRRGWFALGLKLGADLVGTNRARLGDTAQQRGFAAARREFLDRDACRAHRHARAGHGAAGHLRTTEKPDRARDLDPDHAVASSDRAAPAEASGPLPTALDVALRQVASGSARTLLRDQRVVVASCHGGP